MSPRLSKMTPEPSPGRRNSGPPLGPSDPKNCLKKSWKNGSSVPGGGPGARRLWDFWMMPDEIFQLPIIFGGGIVQNDDFFQHV